MPIWDGNWIWLWQANKVLGGDVRRMIDQAKEMQVTGVLIKAHDGTLAGSNSRRYWDQFEWLAVPFRQAGLHVGAWGYIYGNNPKGEAQAAAGALQAGAEWYVIDAESEFEVPNAAQKAEQLCQQFRQLAPGAVLGMSSFAFTDLHRTLPWQVFAKYVDVFLPQVYWATMRRPVEQAFRKSVDTYRDLGKPLAPVGQAYDQATPATMERFAQLVRQEGLPGLSWWSWQHAAPAQREAIARATALFTSPQPAPAALVGKTVTVQRAPLLYLRGELLGLAVVIDNTAYAPVRTLAENLDLRVIWQPDRIDLN